MLMNQREQIREQYFEGIRAMFPELTPNLVDHHSKVAPYIASAQVLPTCVASMADHVPSDAPS